MKDKLRCLFNNFRSHIVEISSNVALRSPYIRCDDPANRDRLFTRNRIWTFSLTVQAIMSCFKETLSSEVIRFLDQKHLPMTTPEAFIKRRRFISSEFFRDMNTWLIRHSADTGFFTTWKQGLHLCGIDGTRLSLPYTPALYKKYRQRNDRNHNLARGVFITDLLNRTIVAADMVPNKTEERKAALNLLTHEEFPLNLQSTVFVMDRGYPSLYLMNWFDANTGGFIIRARKDSSPKIEAFMKSRRRSATVVLDLSENRHDLDYARPRPLTVRLVSRAAICKDEEPMVLITDLDSDIFSDDDIIQAYGKRWNSETEIGTSKNQLQIEIFSGIRDICIRQDFFAAIIMYNIESIIRIPCNKELQKQQKKYVYQVDMNATWQITRLFIWALFKSPGSLDKELTNCVKLFLKLTSIIRPGRSSPRIKRHIKTNGKYITLTNYKRGI